MLDELNSDGIAALQKNNPELYDKFVSEGIIKTGVGGVPVVNKTIAEQTVERGLSGSIKNMANEVVAKTLESESQARSIAANSPDLITLHPNVQKTLTTIAAQYGDVGTGQFGQKAQTLLDSISPDGQVSAENALQIRRLLDGLRIESSYNPNPHLSLQSRGLKELTDSLRGQINKIPGMGDIMTNYTFYIDALDALAREAARRGNSQVLGLIDSIFLGGAISNPAQVAGFATVGALRRTVMSAPAMTGAAQVLNRGVMSPVVGGVIGAASGGASSLSQTTQP